MTFYPNSATWVDIMAERDSGNSWDSLWVDLGLEAPRAAPVSRQKPAPVAVPHPEPVAEVAPAPAPVERPRPVYLTSDEAPDIQAIPVAAHVPVAESVESNDEDDDDDGLETTNPDGTPGKKRRRRRRRGRKGGREEGSDPDILTASVEAFNDEVLVAVAPNAPEIVAQEAVEECDDESEAGVDIIQSEVGEIETFEAVEQPSAMDEELDNDDATPEKKEWSVVSWAELVGGLNR